MAFSLSDITESGAGKPPRITLYGVPGIGKSTFGSLAPSPIFIRTEDGLGGLKVPAFPLCKGFQDVRDQLTALINEEHQYLTVVVDSLDWLEPLIWSEVCQTRTTDNGKRVDHIEGYGYGKGYAYATPVWREFLDLLNRLRDEKGVQLILIAHSQIKRFDSPLTDPYDRYQVKLHARAGAMINEFSDCVLFANWQTHVTKTDVGFNKSVSRGIGGDKRMIFTEQKPGFDAKNRFGLPPEMPLGWDSFSNAMWGTK